MQPGGFPGSVNRAAERRSGEQKPDERARELDREHLPQRCSRRALDLVCADLGEAAPSFLCRKAERRLGRTNSL